MWPGMQSHDTCEITSSYMTTTFIVQILLIDAVSGVAIRGNLTVEHHRGDSGDLISFLSDFALNTACKDFGPLA